MIPTLHIELEKWKYNNEYNCYVSNLGRVKDKNKKELKHFISNASGYSVVHINNEVKTIHRLVLETWIGKSNLTIDHIDNNKRNNKLSNLEYVSEEENIKRAMNKIVKTKILYKAEGQKYICKNNTALLNYCRMCIEPENRPKELDGSIIIQNIAKAAITGETYLGRKWKEVVK